MAEDRSAAQDQPTCDYCGWLGWTVKKYGRVTHKQSCPHRTDPWHQGDPKASAASAWASVQVRRRTVCVYCGARIAGALTKAERRHKHRFSPEQILCARFTCMRHRNLPLDDPHYESLFGGRRG